MDNGDVIVGLDEQWTFAGATAMEWISGFVMFMVAAQLISTNITRGMPILLFVWVATTVSLASVRKQFPDEDRGVRNALMVALGLTPPGIPAPAALQPQWSGAPMRALSESAWYNVLELDQVVGKGTAVDGQLAAAGSTQSREV